jgi:hypothetical protein
MWLSMAKLIHTVDPVKSIRANVPIQRRLRAVTISDGQIIRIVEGCWGLLMMVSL